MKIGLVGGSYQERSLPFDAQRTINLYPVLDQQGKEISALYGTPGLELDSTAGTSATRGGFACANGRAFVVAGDSLYEIFDDADPSRIDSINTSSGIVSMDENGLQLAICDGSSVYVFTYATGVLQWVTDVDLPSAGTITFIDGYFVINKNSSGAFYISALYDGTSWAALDFATAESSPDNLLRVINAVGQLWLMGTFTGEIWTNTGAAAFPFARISGAKMNVGIWAPHTALEFDSSLFWVGRDKNGVGIVYRTKGFSPERISTSPIEQLLQQATDPDSMRAYTYQQDGHPFYIITGGGMPTTLVYDVSAQQWHERAYLNSRGSFEQHLGAWGIYAFGRQLVGSRRDGKIYRMALDIYSDDGDPLAAERVYTHISNENIRTRFRSLEIAMETGVGLQEDDDNTPLVGSDPQITLWISRDGGRTYSNGYSTSFGKVGKYLTRAIFRRIGYAYQITFKVRITDPVKRALIGSYLQ